jgi:predicted MFS family arabinose efflux permease
MCPEGTEATTFALLTAIVNFGSFCSGIVGAKLFGLFGYNGLVIISAAAGFLCLPFIPFLQVRNK